MSTYLKSAAMSLLSKTVQAFLTKYLSDVDVEGVTLPSYDGSGWGVRLSNVQLREGVQLMKMMPGRVVKKRKVKRRLRKRRMIELEAPKERLSHTPKSKDEEEPTNSSGSRHGNNSANEGTESRSDTHIAQHDTEENSVPKNYPLLAEERKYLLGERISHDKSDTSEKRKDVFRRRSRTNSAISTSDLEIAVTTSSDYYTSDDEVENDGSGDGKKPTSSVFSCFVKRKDKKGGSNELSGHSLHQRHQQEEEVKGESEVSTDNVESFEKSNGDAEKTKSQMDDDGDEFGDDKDIYEYYEEEEEYEEDQEVPLRLCLGEHGRIGMVDVRMIGKELHVMVEDAMVTIEAIPILKKDENAEKDGTNENSNVDSGGNSPKNAHSDGVAKESGENNEGEDGEESDNAGADTKNPTKKDKKEPKRDTVGDRVLADNGLARLISAIPHLFLRDICVRLIVRDEPMAQTGDEDGGKTNAATDKNGMDGYFKPQSSSKDTMVEVGIDFLSVTSGEDILSHFQQEHTSAEEDLQNMNNENDGMDSSNLSFEDSVSTKPPSLLKIPSNFVDADGEHKNEYLIRHIRTGRGPSAGISVQLFVPNSGLSRIVKNSTASSGDVWARQHWISSTNNHLLRCSGLDIQARIHMGTKKVDANYSWFYGEYVDEYEHSPEIDSMILFGGGMGTVAPGPQLSQPPPSPDPIPPIERHMSRGNTPRKSNFESTYEDKFDSMRSEIGYDHQPTSSMHPGVDVFHVDSNGIQSCKVPSSFHRLSRGMLLKSCKDCMQLPSEVSDACWEEPPKTSINQESSLDSSIPMPGLALQICIRDPLEINVDRNNIESIGLIQSLFTKPSSVKPKNDSNAKKESEQKSSTAETVTAPSVADDVTQTTTTSTGFFSSLLYGKPEETIHEEEVPEESFESYMQPESISVMGIYLAETVIRIHVMGEEDDDRNLSFCYWQVDTKCITIDRQSLAAPEKSFSDLKLDVGQFVWDEYKGTNKKNLASLGVLQLHGNRHRIDSSNSVSSMIDDYAQNKAPWPSTACALLDIPPPAESLEYKSREGHGLQLRFISTSSSTQSDSEDISRSMIYLRLGLTTVDSNWAIRNEIGTTINQIIRSMAGGKKSTPQETEKTSEQEEQKNESDDSDENEANETKSPVPGWLMSYTIQVDSGNISLPPLIEVKMPMTRFSGERSSLAGFSIESELGKVGFAYGSKAPEPPKPCSLLPQIARLPESVRMHILLCLKDLSPLEIALKVKKEKNSFRRIKSIDKAMLKTAKKITKRDAKSSTNKKRGKMLDTAERRQRILTEIMKLDDSELTNLWSVHQRYQKKLAKKLREEGHAD